MSEQLNSNFADQQTPSANEVYEPCAQAEISAREADASLAKEGEAANRPTERNIELEVYAAHLGAYDETRRERTLSQREKRTIESLLIQREQSERIIAEHRENERLEAQERKERAERLFALAKEAALAYSEAQEPGELETWLTDASSEDVKSAEPDAVKTHVTFESTSDGTKGENASDAPENNEETNKIVISLPAVSITDGNMLQVEHVEQPSFISDAPRVEKNAGFDTSETDFDTMMEDTEYSKEESLFEQTPCDFYDVAEDGSYSTVPFSREDEQALADYEKSLEKRSSSWLTESSDYENSTAESESEEKPRQKNDAFLQSKDPLHFPSPADEAQLLVAESDEGQALLHLGRRDFRRLERAFLKEDGKNSEKEDLLRLDLKGAPHKVAVMTTVQILALQKTRIECCEQILISSVQVSLKSKIKKYRRLCLSMIKGYNKTVLSYKKLTGKELSKIELGLPDSVISTMTPVPLPTVYCVEDEIAGKDLPRVNKKEIEKGYMSFLAEHDDAKKSTGGERTDFAGQSRTVSTACERDTELVALRYEYIQRLLSEKYESMSLSYSVGEMGNPRKQARIEKQLASLKRMKKKALRREMADSTRYYRVKNGTVKSKRPEGSGKESLDSLEMRLEQLLCERESVSERLIALYKGSEDRRSNIEKKLAAALLRERRRAYRAQRKTAKQTLRLHASMQTKEKIFALLNKRIELCVSVAEIDFRLSNVKMRFKAKRELRRKRRAMLSEINDIKHDVRFLLRRAERQDEGYREDKRWVAWLIGLLIVIVIGCAAWYFYSDAIKAFFAGGV